MSNLTDFIGGDIVENMSRVDDSRIYENGFYEGGGRLSGANSIISDGVNTYEAVSLFNEIVRPISSIWTPPAAIDEVYHNYDSITNGTMFTSAFSGTKNIKIPTSFTFNSSEFTGIVCEDLLLDGVITGNPLGVGMSGAVTYDAAGSSGTNMMLGLWDFMPRGGDGGISIYGSRAGGLGGVGFSGGGGWGNGGSAYGGKGGGFVLVKAKNISGAGTIQAKGGNGYTTDGGGGGGGIVLVITESWSGTIGIDVSGGNNRAQVGSYAILKLNTDTSLTLMVHSQNGASADLNGQTPVYGVDASIAW